MALDFTGLDKLTAADRSSSPATQTDTQSASGLYNPADNAAPPISPELLKLQREADQTAQKQLEAREIYARYQNNIMRCGTLRNDLLKKSAAKSATVEELLLIAVELIDRMTGDSNTTTLKVLRRNLYEQYGIGEKPY